MSIYESAQNAHVSSSCSYTFHFIYEKLRSLHLCMALQTRFNKFNIDISEVLTIHLLNYLFLLSRDHSMVTLSERYAFKRVYIVSHSSWLSVCSKDDRSNQIQEVKNNSKWTVHACLLRVIIRQCAQNIQWMNSQRFVYIFCKIYCLLWTQYVSVRWWFVWIEI